MSKQIDYYKLDKLDNEIFQSRLKSATKQIDHALGEMEQGSMNSLDELARFAFADEMIEKFLLLLARLPVFAKDFEELFQNNLDGLQILKKLKFFTNLKIRETIYWLVKLASVFNMNTSSKVDIIKIFSVDKPSSEMERVVDLKFQSAIRRGILFPEGHPKREMYMKEFDHLEKIEPHAVYPTSIYRQSDGFTVATEDSLKIEAVMSTTLTTSIRIATHILGYDSNLLAEIYRPLGRVVVVLDDKLTDINYTRGEVEKATNRRAILDMDPSADPAAYETITIAEQLQRYFAYHNVDVKILAKSGNEVNKDIESVQEILIDLKKLGVMRNEPVLVVGGGVVSDIAGFACALMHRNTPYVMLATSIVSGIDAGPSPRTCCDGQGYKNAFGAFHPPVVTLTDRSLWCTMRAGMIRHGIAEIVKMAVVENYPLFELLEKVGPEFLVKTKFGTDLSILEGRPDIDLAEFDANCERIVGLAMESYVRAEYGNLWETHQCRPHAYGHTWSPGYELPAGMLHGHAVATCMGFGAYLSWKHCNWISKEQFHRICKLINDLELSLWHDVMDDKQIFHGSTKKMIQKRGGNLVAPLPRGNIGECGYLNEISDEELSQYVEEYKELVTSKLGFARNGYGVEAHLSDVGLGDMKMDSLAHVRGEEQADGCGHNHHKHGHPTEEHTASAWEAEEKKCEDLVAEEKMTYEEWIKAAQAGRNANWKFNVTFSPAPDTPTAPAFPHNTLFHNVAEDYAMKNTSVASSNIQTAAKMTIDQQMFAPCMVGTLESQFLKLMAKTTRAQRILDIGTFTGMSAIAFAEGSLAANGQKEEGIEVHTLEFDANTAKAAQNIFDHCEPKVRNSIHLHQGDAVAWLKQLAEDSSGPVFDIIFIDADKDNYIAYYDLAMGTDGSTSGSPRRSLLADGGIILADNSLSALLYDETDDRRVALHQFNQHVKNDPRVEQAVLTMREGVTMISRV